MPPLPPFKRAAPLTALLISAVASPLLCFLMSFRTCARKQRWFGNKEARDKAAAKATKEKAREKRDKERRMVEAAQAQREAAPTADDGPRLLFKEDI